MTMLLPSSSSSSLRLSIPARETLEALNALLLDNDAPGMAALDMNRFATLTYQVVQQQQPPQIQQSQPQQSRQLYTADVSLLEQSLFDSPPVPPPPLQPPPPQPQTQQPHPQKVDLLQVMLGVLYRILDNALTSSNSTGSGTSSSSHYSSSATTTLATHYTPVHLLSVLKALALTEWLLLYGSERSIPMIRTALGRPIEALQQYNTILNTLQPQGSTSTSNNHNNHNQSNNSSNSFKNTPAAWWLRIQGGGVDYGGPVREKAQRMVKLWTHPCTELHEQRTRLADPQSLVPVVDTNNSTHSHHHKAGFVTDAVRLRALQLRIAAETAQTQPPQLPKSNLKLPHGGFGSGYNSNDGKTVVGAAHGIEEMIQMAQRKQMQQQRRFRDDVINVDADKDMNHVHNSSSISVPVPSSFSDYCAPTPPQQQTESFQSSKSLAAATDTAIVPEGDLLGSDFYGNGSSSIMAPTVTTLPSFSVQSSGIPIHHHYPLSSYISSDNNDNVDLLNGDVGGVSDSVSSTSNYFAESHNNNTVTPFWTAAAAAAAAATAGERMIPNLLEDDYHNHNDNYNHDNNNNNSTAVLWAQPPPPPPPSSSSSSSSKSMMDAFAFMNVTSPTITTNISLGAAETTATSTSARNVVPSSLVSTDRNGFDYGGAMAMGGAPGTGLHSMPTNYNNGVIMMNHQYPASAMTPPPPLPSSSYLQPPSSSRMNTTSNSHSDSFSFFY